MDATSSDRTGVFISHSHQDKKWLEELQIHLKPLGRDKDVDIWDDTRIQAGTKWRQEILDAIGRARIAVLLVSPNFMASDFVSAIELSSILAAAEAEGLMVLSLIVRTSGFDRDKRLTEFQTVNDPKQPLIGMGPGKRDVIYTKLAETIENLIQRPAAGQEAVELKLGSLPEQVALSFDSGTRERTRKPSSRSAAARNVSIAPLPGAIGGDAACNTVGVQPL